MRWSFVGTLKLSKEVVEKVSAPGRSRLTAVCLFFLSLSHLPLLTFEPTVRLVAIFPWFSLFFTCIAAVVLLKGDKVAHAAAILNANLETSDERETESRLETVDVC